MGRLFLSLQRENLKLTQFFSSSSRHVLSWMGCQPGRNLASSLLSSLISEDRIKTCSCGLCAFDSAFKVPHSLHA